MQKNWDNGGSQAQSLVVEDLKEEIECTLIKFADGVQSRWSRAAFQKNLDSTGMGHRNFN